MSIFGHHSARGTIVLTLVEALLFGSVFLISGYLILGGARGETIVAFVTEVVLPTGLVMICLLLAGGYKLEAWKSPKTMARRFAGGAIGGSAAGDYINNEVRVASLFRGIKDPEVFDREVRPIFRRLRDEWGGIPFEVINDGEVTALAAVQKIGKGNIMGISMGSSEGGGYAYADGNLMGSLLRGARERHNNFRPLSLFR